MNQPSRPFQFPLHHLPAEAARDLYGRNYHIPPSLGGDFEKIGKALMAQNSTVDANFTKAATKLGADRSKAITDNMRQYILGRFDYGQGMPDVHYDSVLFELLIYMTLQKAQDTPTFAFLKTLSTEAAERRLEKPGVAVRLA